MEVYHTMADKWKEWERRRPKMPNGFRFDDQSKEVKEYLGKWVAWFDSHPADDKRIDPWQEWNDLLGIAPSLKTICESETGDSFPPPEFKAVFFLSFMRNFIIPERRDILRAVIWSLIEDHIVDILCVHSRSKKT